MMEGLKGEIQEKNISIKYVMNLHEGFFFFNLILKDANRTNLYFEFNKNVSKT